MCVKQTPYDLQLLFDDREYPEKRVPRKMNRSSAMDRQLRVSLFWPTLAGGGVERVGLRIARELVARGYQVEIVLARAVGELSNRVPQSVRLIELQVGLGLGRFALSVGPLKRYFQERPPDVFWSHMTEANIVSLIAAQYAGFKGWHIVSEHSTMSARIRRKLRKQILPIAARLLYPQAHRIHAVSTGVADDLARSTGLDRNRIVVVPNPVVYPSIYHEAQEITDHPWFEPGQPPVVLGVGRLVAAKDFATLIHAFDRVRKVLPARLLILGEGPERVSLEALVHRMGLGDHVSMPGFVPNPYKYIKRAAVFVLSSQWEGLPSVLIEAMAIGTPVVSTDCPSGPREILENGKWGTLVPVRDPQSLAEGIIQTIKYPDVGRLEGAMERAREFSVERVMQEYIGKLFPTRNFR